jgi:hypothetical protein
MPTTTLPDPVLELAFEVRVEVEPPVRIGGSPSEQLHFVAITGGTVSGPRFSGRVLPGGGDWYVDRDGVVELDARYLIQHDDGTVVDVVNRGFWHADPETTARLDAFEDVDEREYYYRTSPRFRTDAPQHAWMTRTVFVGMARQEGTTICIRFFALA